jgi:hypothetical protein
MCTPWRDSVYAATPLINLVLNFFMVEWFFLRCGFNHAVKWLKNILTGIEARLNMFMLILIIV